LTLVSAKTDVMLSTASTAAVNRLVLDNRVFITLSPFCYKAYQVRLSKRQNTDVHSAELASGNHVTLDLLVLAEKAQSAGQTNAASLALFNGLSPAQLLDVRLEARDRLLGVLSTVAQQVDVAGRPARSTAPGDFPGLKHALARRDFRGRAAR
jgi:hypothetical protein